MQNKTRRHFIKAVSSTAVAVPLSTLLVSLPSMADSLPMVDPKSPDAKALQFVAVTTKPDQQCAICTYFQGDKDAANGPCQLFPGHVVAGNSWCSGYGPAA